jgi:hypothetical protein
MFSVLDALDHVMIGTKDLKFCEWHDSRHDSSIQTGTTSEIRPRGQVSTLTVIYLQTAKVILATDCTSSSQ